MRRPANGRPSPANARRARRVRARLAELREREREPRDPFWLWEQQIGEVPDGDD